MNIRHILFRNFTVTLASMLLLSHVGMAGPTQVDSEAQARFRQDMAFCESGESGQPLNVCRTEARNALAEGKRGGLSDANGQFASNAVLRCKVFEGDERSACEARVVNPSRLEGSVRSGGLLRESSVNVPSK